MNSRHEMIFGMEINRLGNAGIAQKMHTHWIVQAISPNGQVLWTEEFNNLVVDQGLNDCLDKYFKGSGYSAAWYVGITGGNPSFASTDTPSSHPGWTEVTAYSEAERPALVLGAVSNKTVSNTNSRANFTVSANGTVIGGAFIISNSTKGGTAGVLYGGGNFSTNKTLDSGDILSVTVTLSAAAA